jgi:hypothetical protein
VRKRKSKRVKATEKQCSVRLKRHQQYVIQLQKQQQTKPTTTTTYNLTPSGREAFEQLAIAMP